MFITMSAVPLDGKKKVLVGSLCGVFAAIIWGLWPVITRFGVTTDFSPEEIVAVRFIFAGIALLPFYIKSKCYKRIGIFKALVISSGAGALYVYVSALGLKFVPAGHLGVVETGTMLALSALGGFLFLKEKRSGFQIVGYITVVSGMLLVNWQSFQSASTETILGDLLLVAGGILWAVYTILSKKWNFTAWDAVATVSVWSMVIWVPLIFLFGDVNLTTENFVPWFYQGIGQGIVTAILGLWFYTIGVSFLGAARGSLFGALVPAIAVLGGLIFLAELPTLYELIGVTLTTIGIVIAMK